MTGYIQKHLKDILPHPWWNVQKWISYITSLYSYIALLVFVVLYRLQANELYAAALKDEDIKENIEGFYLFFCSHERVNLIAASVLLLCTFVYCLRIWQQRLFQPRLTLIFVFAIYLLKSDSYWSYADIIAGFDWKSFALLLLWMCLLVSVTPSIIRIITTKFGKPENKQFSLLSNDIPSNSQTLDTARLAYAIELCEQLKVVDVNKAPFTVGILGEWGSGKTTFLNMMKENLRVSCICVEFNPWNSQDPQTIIQDYFACMNKHLSPFCSDITTSMAKYANILSGIKSPWSSILSQLTHKVLSPNDGKLKGIIQKQLKGIDRKIVVFIDDLDRLDDTELFEVLRLVRNTANFANVIYVLAYDKTYITGILNKKDIPLAERYVDKIVQLELKLPAFSTNMIPSCLWLQVKKLERKPDIQNLLLRKIYEMDYLTKEYVICKYLPQIRDVYRFANLLAINYRCIHPEDIDVVQYFMLQLLEYAEPKAYDKLKNSPNELLSEKNEVTGAGIAYYELKKDAYEGNCKKLLESIFSSSNRNKNSIRYVEKYNRYFTYGLDSEHVSTALYKELLYGQNNNELLKKCINTPKRFESLYYLLLTDEIEQKSDAEVLSYFKLLFNFYYASKHAGVPMIFSIKLEKLSSRKGNLYSQIEALFEKAIPLSDFRIEFARLLQELYGWDPISESQDPEYHSSIRFFERSKIEQWAQRNIEKFVGENEVNSISDFVNKDTCLCKLLKASTCSYTDDDYNTGYLSLVFQELRKQFENANLGGFEEMCSSMFYAPEEDYYQEFQESKQDLIRSIFGTTDNYKILVNVCVKASEAEKERHFKTIGI